MSSQPTIESQGSHVTDLVLGAVGGVVGASLGYFLFQAIVSQGFYALILPGALTGMGCGSLSRRRSVPLGCMCAVIAAAVGILAEWQFAPFVADRSLGYFITHLHELKSVTQGMLLIGTIMAFWFGLGREGGAWLRKPTRGN